MLFDWQLEQLQITEFKLFTGNTAGHFNLFCIIPTKLLKSFTDERTRNWKIFLDLDKTVRDLYLGLCATTSHHP